MKSMWSRWMVSEVLLSAIFVSISSSLARMEHLQPQLGMMHIPGSRLFQPPGKQIEFPKRSPAVPRLRRSETEDDRQLVTIDLSALRPSLPGLILYKYGDLAPKLVQVDLETLNPLLQPHVIWPQYHQQISNRGESHLNFVDDLDLDAIIPFLDHKTLVPKSQKIARITSATSASDWPEFSEIDDGDVYDFLSDSSRNEELMILHDSLPLADEVIVPLDWEQENTAHHFKRKRDVFLSQEWKPGGYFTNRFPLVQPKYPKNYSKIRGNVIYNIPFYSYGWQSGRKVHFPAPEKDFENKSNHLRVESEEVERLGQKSGTKKSIYNSNRLDSGKMDSIDFKDIKSLSPKQLKRENIENHSSLQDAQAGISSQESGTAPKHPWKLLQNFRTQ